MMKITFSRLLNVVLAVLLLASVFLVNATTSRSNATSIGAYDPWVDINGDGIINILDATQIGLGWQAQGDPTRNINITNWWQARQELRIIYNESLGVVPNDQYGVTYVTTVSLTGYKFMDIHAKAVGIWTSQCSIMLSIAWNSNGIITYEYDTSFNTDLNQQRKPWYGTASTYTATHMLIRSTKLDLYVSAWGSNPPADITLLTIAVYLTN